jgi:hypothetical protein
VTINRCLGAVDLAAISGRWPSGAVGRCSCDVMQFSSYTQQQVETATYQHVPPTEFKRLVVGCPIKQLKTQRGKSNI